MVVSARSIVGAVGNTIALTGSGLTGATAVLAQQGPADPQTGAPSTVTTSLELTVADDSDASFIVPDGALTGSLVVTSADGTLSVSIPISIVSQYVQVAEYQAAGEGTDTSQFTSSDLDSILRRASSYVDSYIGYSEQGGVRITSLVEQHPWRKATRRIYPYKAPIRTVNQFVIEISPSETATFSPDDIVINRDSRYIEILSYAVASYALFGAISNLGFTANIVQLYYTAGYYAAEYPQAIKDATTMTATEMIDYALVQKAGLGGLSRVRQGYQQIDRRNEPFAIPQPAKEVLRPFMRRRLA